MRAHVLGAVVIVLFAQAASAPASFAQGCILLRQTSPLFGTRGADAGPTKPNYSVSANRPPRRDSP